MAGMRYFLSSNTLCTYARIFFFWSCKRQLKKNYIMGEFYLGQKQNYKRWLIGKFPPNEAICGRGLWVATHHHHQDPAYLAVQISTKIWFFFLNFNVSNKFRQDKIFLKVEKKYRLFSVGRQYKHFISLEPPHRKFGHGNIFTACCRPFQNRGLKVATIICFSYSAGLFFFRRWIMQQAGNQVGGEAFA